MIESNEHGSVISLHRHTYFFPDEGALRGDMISARLEESSAFNDELFPDPHWATVESIAIAWGYASLIVCAALLALSSGIAAYLCLTQGLVTSSLAALATMLGFLGICIAWGPEMIRSAVDDYLEWRVHRRLRRFENASDFNSAVTFLRENRLG